VSWVLDVLFITAINVATDGTIVKEMASNSAKIPISYTMLTDALIIFNFPVQLDLDNIMVFSFIHHPPARPEEAYALQPPPAPQAIRVQLLVVTGTMTKAAFAVYQPQ